MGLIYHRSPLKLGSFSGWWKRGNQRLEWALRTQCRCWLWGWRNHREGMKACGSLLETGRGPCWQLARERGPPTTAVRKWVLSTTEMSWKEDSSPEPPDKSWHPDFSLVRPKAENPVLPFLDFQPIGLGVINACCFTFQKRKKERN